jgi:hypothetical protein
MAKLGPISGRCPGIAGVLSASLQFLDKKSLSPRLAFVFVLVAIQIADETARNNTLAQIASGGQE